MTPLYSAPDSLPMEARYRIILWAKFGFISYMQYHFISRHITACSSFSIASCIRWKYHDMDTIPKTSSVVTDADIMIWVINPSPYLRHQSTFTSIAVNRCGAATHIGGTPRHPNLPLVTAVCSGNHHLVCPYPTLWRRYWQQGAGCGVIRLISPLFLATFDVVFDKLGQI